MWQALATIHVVGTGCFIGLTLERNKVKAKATLRISTLTPIHFSRWPTGAAVHRRGGPGKNFISFLDSARYRKASSFLMNQMIPDGLYGFSSILTLV